MESVVNAGKGSSIRLTGFAEYRRVGPNKVVGGLGADQVSLDENGQVHIVLSGLPLRGNLARRSPRPGFGLLLGYGFREVTEELHRARVGARERGFELAVGEFEVAIGHLPIGIVDRPTLKSAGASIGFANFIRMSANLQSQVAMRIAECALEDGLKVDPSWSRRALVASFPQYWSQVLHDDKALRHLRVVAIPVADFPGRPEQIRLAAFLQPGTPILDLCQGSRECRVSLPTWFSNEAEAEELRDRALAVA